MSGDYLKDRFEASDYADDYGWFGSDKKTIRYTKTMKGSVEVVKEAEVNRYKCDVVDKGGF